jgi:hypothetical protein
MSPIGPSSPGATSEPVSFESARLSFPMKVRDSFFARVTSSLRAGLPPELARFKARPMFNLMKVAYANERVHYEVAFDIERRLLEIALHFEDGPVSTSAYLHLLDRQIVEIKHELGHEVELERWTATWGRLYEIWQLTTLDRDVADRVAERLAAYITLLQPLIEEAGIAPERSAEQGATGHGSWRKRTKRPAQ